jgi:hypothetical protein
LDIKGASSTYLPTRSTLMSSYVAPFVPLNLGHSLNDILRFNIDDFNALESTTDSLMKMRIRGFSSLLGYSSL